jgi:hypothetical protein
MTLTDRIWNAHPLALAHRAVLLAIARQLPEGATELMVNRAALARNLEVPPAAVGKALIGGTQVGLCRVLGNGKVAFTAEGLPGIADTNQRVAEEIHATREVHRPMSPKDAVMAEFARQWQEREGQRYVFTRGKDDKLAAGIADTITLEDLTARVRRYLSHPDQFYARCAFSFGVFVSRINDFAVDERRRQPRGEDEYERAERRQRAREEAARAQS